MTHFLFDSFDLSKRRLLHDLFFYCAGIQVHSFETKLTDQKINVTATWDNHHDIDIDEFHSHLQPILSMATTYQYIGTEHGIPFYLFDTDPSLERYIHVETCNTISFYFIDKRQIEQPLHVEDIQEGVKQLIMNGYRTICLDSYTTKQKKIIHELLHAWKVTSCHQYKNILTVKGVEWTLPMTFEQWVHQSLIHIENNSLPLITFHVPYHAQRQSEKMMYAYCIYRAYWALAKIRPEYQQLSLFRAIELSEHGLVTVPVGCYSDSLFLDQTIESHWRQRQILHVIECKTIQEVAQYRSVIPASMHSMSFHMEHGYYIIYQSETNNETIKPMEEETLRQKLLDILQCDVEIITHIPVDELPISQLLQFVVAKEYCISTESFKQMIKKEDPINRMPIDPNQIGLNMSGLYEYLFFPGWMKKGDDGHLISHISLDHDVKETLNVTTFSEMDKMFATFTVQNTDHDELCTSVIETSTFIDVMKQAWKKGLFLSTWGQIWYRLVKRLSHHSVQFMDHFSDIRTSSVSALHLQTYLTQKLNAYTFS